MQRIGVFVCHCGSNIAATVDVKKVVEMVRLEPGVVHAEDYQYMCSEVGQAKIATAIRISRRTLRIVHQNIVFALSVKALVLVLGALGLANMWAAVFADVGVSVIAILNAMRALRTKKL